MHANMTVMSERIMRAVFEFFNYYSLVRYFYIIILCFCTDCSGANNPDSSVSASSLKYEKTYNNSSKDRPSWELLVSEGNSDREICAAAVNYQGNFERCSVNLVGNGDGAVVSVVTECGQDSCSVESRLIKKNGIPVELRSDLGGGIAFNSSLTFYVMDEVMIDKDEDPSQIASRPPSLVKVELSTGKRTFFADCFSPKLSPKGNWFVCRNCAGDLLRVPVTGGKAELVAKNPTAARVPCQAYSFNYPSEVSFPDSKTVVFPWNDGTDRETSLPWSE